MGLRGVLSALCMALAAASAPAAVTYTIGAAQIPESVCYSLSGKAAVTNEWTSGVYVYSTGAISTPVPQTVVDSDRPGLTNVYTLVASEMGFAYKRMECQYYLGDTLTPPENVDWYNTYLTFMEAYAPTDNDPAFLFCTDTANPCVYALKGGTWDFTWKLKGGTTKIETFNVEASARGRPKCLFWTEEPYNGPTISLRDKFVKLYGPDALLACKTRTVTNIVGGVQVVQDDTISEGVYIDPSAKVLKAVGELTGQFTIAYYDSGDYKNLLCVEVVSVQQPITVTAKGVIGEPLTPTGFGYDTDGLKPIVRTGIGDSDDDRGDYLYLHACDNSYSEKDNCLYPLRPSVGKRWMAEVFWMETDPMGVSWPFELVQYENDWPTRGYLYVRGDDPANPGAKIYFPDAYEPTLCEYQDPYDHAVAVAADKSFYTKGAGRSLIKLTWDDEVVFLPIESVLRSDTNYFSLASSRIPVGERFRVRGGTRAGLTEGGLNLVLASDEASGYIYKPASGTQYDVNLYYETTNATADAISTSDTGTDVPSAIYAINEGSTDIEVWWSRRVKEHVSENGTRETLPAWIDIPCLPQRYRPVWPEQYEAPTIVIASEEGSANECIYPRYGAAYFDRPSAQMRLANRKYFPNGSGSVAFWTRAAVYDDALIGATNAPSCLMQLGNSAGEAILLRIGRDEKLQLVKHGQDKPIIEMALPPLKRANSWMHIGFKFENGQDFTLYVGGTNHVATGRLAEPAAFLGERLDACAMGTTLGTITNALQSVVGGEKVEDQSQGEAGSLSFVEAYNWDDVKTSLAAGMNVRLMADIDFPDTGKDNGGLVAAGSHTLDMNGHTIKSLSRYRYFYLNNGSLRIIGTGVFDGNGRTYVSDGHFAYIPPGKTLTIDGNVTIKNMKTPADHNGGAIYVAGGNLVMNAGTIKDCSSAVHGGAVYCGGTMTMNGGTIEGCSAAGSGGGIYSYNGTVTINGGIIRNNHATWGGGVNCQGAFAMYGGAIYGNTSPNPQPCIRVESKSTATLMGGFLDVAPIEANICQDSSVTFTEPPYFGPSAEGLYLIGLGAAEGRQVAEIRLHAHALTDAEIVASMYALADEAGSDMTGYYSFREGEDLASVFQSTRRVDVRTFKDRVLGFTCHANNTVLTTPGAPGRARAILYADSEPTVYYQNDPTQPGFNPNEEHAFVEARDDGSYTVWALRGDLNDTTGAYKDRSSPPGVFVEYTEDGEARLQFYHVAVTNPIPFTGANWSWVKGRTLAGSATAGNILPGPHPLDTLDYDPWLAEDWWEKGAGPSSGPAYRDREGQLWARCAGTLPIHMFYRMQDGFFFPQYDDNEQPAVGDAIPWLSLFGVTDDYQRNDPNALDPACWTWEIAWPSASGVMKIGQTLYEATEGLPGVYNMKSVAVIYPDPNMDETGRTVMLSDPTVMQSGAFDYRLLAELGLTTDPNGGLTLRKGVYYFTGLPPYLSSRVYVDPSNNKLCFIGKYDKKNAGVSILYPNVLTESEVELLKNLVPKECRTTSAYDTWCAAVDSLAQGPVEPNVTKYDADAPGGWELKTAYTARDSYALTAMGMTNWVVLIENDATNQEMGVTSGSAVNMHVFYVTNEYYTGSVVAREDENDLLSQQLSILYTEAFGGNPDNYEFEWKFTSPTADGKMPDLDGTEWKSDSAREGTHFTIGDQGDSLKNMVNQYWVCRYRAKDGSTARRVMGDAWSDWCGPTLAEGWIERCLNNVTPFNQLMTDLYDDAVETPFSMIAKAGAPYEGDVALNQDALEDCGLIQLYTTLFNAAEKISLMQRIDDSDANEQLMLCAERLDDLYGVLGDEAYTDAKDPTIHYGSASLRTYGALESPLFCFDNQVPTLLDEELALMRGRSGESSPGTQTGPYYNRLLWNFTKGITAGEVAYAVNYSIQESAVEDDSPVISEEDAAIFYPQGHGDAYGHYLSALTGWYRLLRNPYFSWVRSQGEMLVADAVANVDYYEERKFVTSALKAARTAADVVNLTGCKAWGDGEADFAGYCDSDENRAFGYGEWANRGAYGALINWAVGNSLLPAGEAAEDDLLNDQGLSQIDRSTVGELDELGGYVAAIQRAEDQLDAGLNPLGLSDDAIPFDIAPDGAADGSDTHYEQVRARADTALANANELLETAEESSMRLRTIWESDSELEDSIQDAELAYKQQLIGYYGRPYSDDVGPGKTYAQGYDGPDLLHYMWMDVSQYALADYEDTFEAQTYHYSSLPVWSIKYLFSSFTGGLIKTLNKGLVVDEFWFSASSSGITVKPANITGTRPAQGTIQEKYGEFLSAYAALKLAQTNYEYQQDVLERQMMLCEVFSIKTFAAYVKAAASDLKTSVENIKNIFTKKSEAKNEAKSDQATAAKEASEDVTADAKGIGMTVVTDISATVAKAETPYYEAEQAKTIEKTKKNKIKLAGSTIKEVLSLIKNEAAALLKYNQDEQKQLTDLVEAASKLNDYYSDYHESYLKTVQAIEAYKSEIDEAELVLEKRELDRRHWVGTIELDRYADMFFRLTRNAALERYSASFDLAQKYAWEAAKAYDYETAGGGFAEGENIGGKIIAARCLGDLNDALGKLDANWIVLKPRLGLNNPQPYATWFSMRGECFRILPGAEGDAAWAKELTKYWTDDIQSNSDFRHYCQRFKSTFGLKEKEPGLIIPFETTIDFAKNLFGNDLAGGDHAYDSTWYATRIAAAGLWFDGYNAKAAGYKGKVQLADTPVAYLVPIGADRMRAPGLDDDTCLEYNVVDQVLPLPYAIGSEYLSDSSWFPTVSDGDLGGADSESRIRRHPSFRAYFDATGGEPTDGALDCTRLIGRSVWNTKWMLVIPAGAMNADREKALSIFINGSDENRDGKLDLLPVSDIRIGFKTYSNSGN